MTKPSGYAPHIIAIIEACFLVVALGFFVYLMQYYLTTSGGPTLLAFTLVPVAYVLYVLDALRTNNFYTKLGLGLNITIAAAMIAFCFFSTYYLYIEFEDLGTVRAGSWDPLDMVIGGGMAMLVMEYTRKRQFELFVLNIILILYAVYGYVVPGMFYHPGLSWERIVTSVSLEDSTGIFSSLPQLALTLIGSFVLVLSLLRAFGCIESILRAASRLAIKSPYALPQAAVLGSFGVAAVSGSGAANAVTTGSATIPAMIEAGMPREGAAAVEASASLGGQLMPPIMGISAFLMANFLDVSYGEVVARAYVPALIYFITVFVSVYLYSRQCGTMKKAAFIEETDWRDWINVSAFFFVVVGFIIAMAVYNMPPMFAALYVFETIGAVLLARLLFELRARPWRETISQVVGTARNFLDSFTTMTTELTLLLATLSILTSALINTGVPTKVGFILVDAAAVNMLALGLVAFFFGALLGTGLPPAPTYILTALVIAPHMIKIGMDPWAVHFFAFFLAVWGELTPPTSVVAAITSKIANASFIGTLGRALLICSPLFILMAAMFVRPELVVEPGLNQLGAMVLVLTSSVGLAFAFQATFSDSKSIDVPLRILLAAFSMVALFHSVDTFAAAGCVGVAIMVVYWVMVRKNALLAVANT
ncbi:MAG TPA: TRAP transporter large permease subunit [Hyphomicrobiaceae bacterium]|nr:TRAP transporter large permease subunit [Hyphomicrobiaceae bacterium]